MEEGRQLEFKPYYSKGHAYRRSHTSTVKVDRQELRRLVIHRNWESNANIQVSFFDDRIQIVSPGGLPSGLTESEYMKGKVSVLRNPIIGSLMNRLGYIERFGTGVLRIKESYKDLLLAPRFGIEANSLSVTLPSLTAESELSEDERTVLELVKERGEITRKTIEDAIGFNTNKASRILKSLTDRDMLNTIGAAKSTRYIMP